MTNTTRVVALDLGPDAERDAFLSAYFAKCEDKIGFIPNVLKAYAFDATKLAAFIHMVDNLMLAESGLDKLEREMIAVAVSAVNHCHYCLTAHGAAVRMRSGDPSFGEAIAQNYRAISLSDRHRAMLDFAVKLTESPDKMGEADRQALRDAGFSNRDIWDIAAIAGFFNMSNRIAAATEMMPNPEYHHMARKPAGGPGGSGG